MNAISDTVQTLAAVALFAKGPTRRFAAWPTSATRKPTASALAVELRKFGAEVEERADGLRIVPRTSLHGATIDTYDDHRMAMSMALAGLKIPGVVINDPGCTAKTYPRFFDDLAARFQRNSRPVKKSRPVMTRRGQQMQCRGNFQRA